MRVADRISRMSYVPTHSCLIVSDIKGRIHKLNMELQLLQSSPTTGYQVMINALTTTDRFVFTRNLDGGLTKWDIETLLPLDVYDAFHLRDGSTLLEEEEPSPNLARGITAYKGRVYANNGYGQYVVLDEETFEVVEIRQPFYEVVSFADCMNTEHPDIHAISETRGMVHIGNLETGEFPIHVRADYNPSHCIRYDKRHHRFIATQDNGIGEERNIRNGIISIDVDGSSAKQFSFTNDDVEFVECSEDYRFVYAGGFDGYIYKFDNSEKDLKLNKVIGPFRHQLLYMIYVSENDMYVLTQKGELLCVDQEGIVKHKMEFQEAGIWALEPHPENDSIVYCAKDSGVEIIQYGSAEYGLVSVKRIANHNHSSFGMIRRVQPLPDGSYIAIGRGCYAFRADKDGNILWYRKLTKYPLGVAANYDYTKVLVSTAEGVVLELSVDDNQIIDMITTDGIPAAAACYTPDGRRLVATRTGQLHVFAADSQELLSTIELGTFPKRLLPQKDGRTFIIGNFGLLELDLHGYTIKKQWTELIFNTPENAVLLGEYVHITSYGRQLASYSYQNGEIVDLIEGLLDFTKAVAGQITENGVPLLLVGGRSGFLNVYRVVDGAPQKVRELYLY